MANHPPPNEALSITLDQWHSVRDMAQPIRREVFVSEQGVPIELEWDEWDSVSTHAIACLEGRPVGTGRLLPADGDGVARIGRMAVLKTERGHGVGAAILNALVVRARETGVREIVLHAQSQAAEFYGRFGFTPRGAVFFEAGIAHVEMSLALKCAANAP